MKHAIAILLLCSAFASCQERNGTAPSTVPLPVTQTAITQVPHKLDKIPYSFSLLFPESPEGWCGRPFKPGLFDSIEKKTKAKGEYSGHGLDEWGRVAVVIQDTTRRNWSLNSIASCNRSIVRMRLKL
jgi:hypothetical protein